MGVRDARKTPLSGLWDSLWSFLSTIRTVLDPRQSEEPEEPWDTHLGLDEIMKLLKNERRRLILDVLEKEQHTTLGNLSERVAMLENGVDEIPLGSDYRKRAYVSLYQSHLPKLDKADIVDYDKKRGTVETGSEFDVVLQILNQTRAITEGDQ